MIYIIDIRSSQAAVVATARNSCQSEAHNDPVISKTAKLASPHRGMQLTLARRRFDNLTARPADSSVNCRIHTLQETLQVIWVIQQALASA